MIRAVFILFSHWALKHPFELIFFLIKWRNLVLCFNQLVLQTIFTSSDPKGGIFPRRTKKKTNKKRRRKERRNKKSNMCFDLVEHTFEDCIVVLRVNVFFLFYFLENPFFKLDFRIFGQSYTSAKVDVRQTVIMLHYGCQHLYTLHTFTTCWCCNHFGVVGFVGWNNIKILLNRNRTRVLEQNKEGTWIEMELEWMPIIAPKIAYRVKWI